MDDDTSNVSISTMKGHGPGPAGITQRLEPAREMFRPRIGQNAILQRLEEYYDRDIAAQIEDLKDGRLTEASAAERRRHVGTTVAAALRDVLGNAEIARRLEKLGIAGDWELRWVLPGGLGLSRRTQGMMALGAKSVFPEVSPLCLLGGLCTPADVNGVDFGFYNLTNLDVPAGPPGQSPKTAAFNLTELPAGVTVTDVSLNAFADETAPGVTSWYAVKYGALQGDPVECPGGTAEHNVSLHTPALIPDVNLNLSNSAFGVVVYAALTDTDATGGTLVTSGGVFGYWLGITYLPGPPGPQPPGCGS